MYAFISVNLLECSSLKAFFNLLFTNIGSYQSRCFKMTGIVWEWELSIPSDISSMLWWKLTFSFVTHVLLSANLKAKNWHLQIGGQDTKSHAMTFIPQSDSVLVKIICFPITFFLGTEDVPWVLYSYTVKCLK